jgi:lipopolysaccharide/colanic/teichoic acid biosynthesis glycosyltransferase
MMRPQTRSRPDRKVVLLSPTYVATVIAPRRFRIYDWIKAAADLTIALILVILTLPMVVVAGLLVKFTSRGPILYSQLRVGRDGRVFSIFKLRTMYHKCEALTGARWCVCNDPRVTPLGRILRRMHIDELPQLWNVLFRDMSLVGPRPERPEFVGPLEEAIPGYCGRLAVRPGVTGLAQIQLPADTNFDSVRKKLVLDLCYVERYGAWLDLRLLLGTVLYLGGVSYARTRRLMGLPGSNSVEPDTDDTVLEHG